MTLGSFPALAALAVLLVLTSCADTEREQVEVELAPAAPAAGPAPTSTPAPAAPVDAAPDAGVGVRASFASYKAAAVGGDGSGAASFVDRTTVAYYDEALRLARTAPESEVRGLPLVDRLVVLSIRQRIPVAVLRGLDGRRLVASGVAEGWIGRQGPEHMELGEVSVNGDVADAPVLVDGRPSEFAFRFRREPAGWRLDLTSVHPATEQALQAAITQSGLEADRFMEAALQQATGRPVDPSIWSPPL
jgi:hypothetical protein